jgi:hypothetical protein
MADVNADVSLASYAAGWLLVGSVTAAVIVLVWFFERKKGFRARGRVEPLLGGYYQPMCHSNWLGLRVGMCHGETNGPVPVIDATYV